MKDKSGNVSTDRQKRVERAEGEAECETDHEAPAIWLYVPQTGDDTGRKRRASFPKG